MKKPPVPRPGLPVRRQARTTQLSQSGLANISTSGNAYATEDGTGGLHLHSDLPEIDVSLLSFWFRKVKDKCTVFAGTLRIYGVGRWNVSETTVTLSGSTEWVYVKHLKDHSATTIEHSATEPSATDPTAFNLPLFRFTGYGSGFYDLAKICHSGGDLWLGAPL